MEGSSMLVRIFTGVQKFWILHLSTRKCVGALNVLGFWAPNRSLALGFASYIFVVIGPQRQNPANCPNQHNENHALGRKWLAMAIEVLCLEGAYHRHEFRVSVNVVESEMFICNVQCTNKPRKFSNYSPTPTLRTFVAFEKTYYFSLAKKPSTTKSRNRTAKTMEFVT